MILIYLLEEVDALCRGEVVLHGYPQYPNTPNCSPEEADEFLEPQVLELNLNSALTQQSLHLKFVPASSTL